MAESQKSYVGGYVPVRVREALSALARENERSVSAELRRALASHLERERGLSRAGVGR